MNKLNLSFIMSSYGDDLRCKDVHASGTVEAQALKVKQGGNFAGGGAYRDAKPTDGTTAGAVGDILFVNAGDTSTDNGVYVCKTAGGSTSAWIRIAKEQ